MITGPFNMNIWLNVRISKLQKLGGKEETKKGETYVEGACNKQ